MGINSSPVHYTEDKEGAQPETAYKNLVSVILLVREAIFNTPFPFENQMDTE